MISDLERAIRDKMLALFQDRMQADIERMSVDLREQGADESYVRACADWYAEENMRGILEGSRDAAKDLIASDFFNDEPRAR